MKKIYMQSAILVVCATIAILGCSEGISEGIPLGSSESNVGSSSADLMDNQSSLDKNQSSDSQTEPESSMIRESGDSQESNSQNSIGSSVVSSTEKESSDNAELSGSSESIEGVSSIAHQSSQDIVSSSSLIISTHSQKKGMCLATYAGNRPDLVDLNASWYYRWSMWRDQDVLDTAIEFVPMVWGWGVDTEQDITDRLPEWKESGVTHLLGYNEPDRPEQANISVETALDAWPFLEATGLRLGSPATTAPNNDWMVQFMEGVEQRKLRVDFIAVHWYRRPNANEFMQFLDDTYQMYQKPIWVTEFAPADWTVSTVDENPYTVQEYRAFMEEVFIRMEELPYLERHAWFQFGLESPHGWPASFYDANGSLLPLGEDYRSF